MIEILKKKDIKRFCQENSLPFLNWLSWLLLADNW
jgi:hypothetical protein